MKRTLTSLTILCCVTVLAWAGVAIRGKVVQNRATMTGIVDEREGWARYEEQMKHLPLTCNFTIPRECRVAKTQVVTEDAMELSGNLFFSGLHANDFGDCHFVAPGWAECTLYVELERDAVTAKFRYWCTLGEDPRLAMPDYVEYLSPWYDKADVPNIDWDFTINVTHSRLHRTRTIKTWVGSATGPTHSTESCIADEWQAEKPYSVTATFGALSWNKANEIPIDTPVGVEHQLHWNYADTEFVRLTLDSSSFEWDFSAIEDHCYGAYATAPKGTAHGEGDMYVEGSGNVLTFQSGPAPGVGQHPYFSKLFTHPFAADFTELGLGKWQEQTHNATYDPVLVWVWDGKITCPEWQIGGACAAPAGFFPQPWASDGGLLAAYDYGTNPLDFACPFCGSQMRPSGMNKEPWVGAAWPDTSETDWISVGAFADGSAAPLPISELHSVFSPYAQQIAPYSQWDFKAGYVREFWGGALAWLYDRKSLRANLIDVA